jgi:hypothetical protein
MSHPYHHSISSAKKHGGIWQDYISIHNWFDETKAHYPDMRHRALRHHSEGIFWCEQQFGVVILNSDGKLVPTRAIGEQHLLEDIGHIPTIKDYLDCMSQENWMFKPGEGRKMLKEIADEKLDYVKDGELETFKKDNLIVTSPYKTHDSIEEARAHLKMRETVKEINIIKH